MKILVITRNAWDDSNAIGNTLSNFFEGMGNTEFANIYFRTATPQNGVVSDYFQTSETDIIKHWFSPEKMGRVFKANELTKSVRQDAKEKNEKKIVHFIRKNSVKIAYKVSDFLWYSEKWQNQHLKLFVESFSPDIVFAFVKSAPQYYLTIKFIKDNYNIPLISWIADDEYTGLLNRNAKKEIENLKYIMNNSAAVFGCSEEICQYYNKLFGAHAKPLYKGCDLSDSIKEKSSQSVSIVYAGNLLYGRQDVICRIAEGIEHINTNGNSVTFDIYSNTELSKTEISSYFDKYSFTKYHGRKSYELIKQHLSMTDIVLHVESFEDKQIEKTKYSFSTKIIDALQSGSALLAVGPREISSIKYIQRIPGAYVITDLGDLERKLQELLVDKSDVSKSAKKIRAYASKYHDKLSNSQRLGETIRKIVEENL